MGVISSIFLDFYLFLSDFLGFRFSFSFVFFIVGALDTIRDKRVTEIDYQLKYAIFSTACSIGYKYCTRPIRKHLYLGIFKDPKVVKLNPRMGILLNKWP